MTIKRLWHTIRLVSTRGARGRAEYLKKNNVFADIGENCRFMGRKVPLYANLIKLGNNVNIASNVTFITHDGIHHVLNGRIKEKFPEETYRYKEKIGCIEVGNNVNIGSNSVISYNVKIGDDVLVIAGSVVTNDIPSNSVVRGNPAKVICTFEQFSVMKKIQKTYPDELTPVMGTEIGPDLEEWLWNDFYSSRNRA